MTSRLAQAVACVAAVAICAPAGAAAKPATATNLRDVRYCEIFTVELQPVPEATIWNTIGLSRCPGAWWSSLDTGALAEAHGSDLTVLNGPRAWVVDAAATPDRGPVETFAGERLRQVATIDLSSLPGLQLPAYTDFRITRDNRWVYERGRRVFELASPGGRIYVMQSYSKGLDPTLDYRDLPRLGSRLDAPEGWRYRTRRLKRKLVLRAKGSAVIVQDSLRNTYQRRPRGH